LKKRGHVCSVTGQPDGSAEKAMKVGESPSGTEVYTSGMGSMYPAQNMVPNGLNANEQLKNENDQLKKLISELESQNIMLQQECIDLRNKLFSITGQMPGASAPSERDLLIYKTELSSPSMADDIPNHIENIEQDQATTSDLNELSSAVQQIDSAARGSKIPRK